VGAVLLDLRPIVDLTDEQFYELCRVNRELRLERTAEGEILIMPPTGSQTGRRNSKITQRLANWAEQDGSGVAFDSSAGFKLPNGATRSPDASWIKLERWESLTPKQQEIFAPICPDFVIELRSTTDNAEELHAKMLEYVENGAQLGWLIDPQERRVYVYRPQNEAETLENPARVEGDPTLKGFVLDLQEIW
jgi:Uma2 family endonuclease